MKTTMLSTMSGVRVCEEASHERKIFISDRHHIRTKLRPRIIVNLSEPAERSSASERVYPQIDRPINARSLIACNPIAVYS
jgi:hypothetical protein